ncbi:MAG: MFS transporter [Micromonosporaceae bacterium]
MNPDSGTAPAPPPILTRQMMLLLVVTTSGLASFFLLFPVVPLYVADGEAGTVGAGVATGVMMLATVLTELVVPRLVARHGYRTAMALAVLLLGLPAVPLVFTSWLPLVLLVCVARGAGLGILVVAATALAAELSPPQRRAEGLGVYGVAAAIPPILCLPAGVWLVEYAGYWPVFLAGAGFGVLALGGVVSLPNARGASERQVGVLRGLGDGGFARPVIIFTAVTIAAGITITFLPLAVPERFGYVAAVALLAQSLAVPVARWSAGWLGDRYGSARLLIPGVVAVGIGTAGLAWVEQSAVMIVATMALFGVGLGLAQNVTLALMVERSPRSGYGRVAAQWNLAYDGGMGIGAAGFGVLCAQVGYPVGFVVTAGVVLAALVPAWLDVRRPAGTRDPEAVKAAV